MQKYFTADIVNGNSILSGQGLATFVWKKQVDNSWKIILEIENYSVKTY
jgi:ketosteroid isomerase-like protein